MTHRSKPYFIIVAFVLSIAILFVTALGILSKVQKVSRTGQLYDYLNRAETAIEEEKYVNAFSLLQKALALNPGDTKIIARQADVAFLNGDYRVAQTLYQQASDFNNAQIVYYNGLKALSDLDYTQAREQFALAIGKISEDTPLQQSVVEELLVTLSEIEAIENIPLREATVAKTLIDHKAYFEAEATLLHLLADQPVYRDAHYLLGVTYLHLGKKELAQKSLQEALSIDPNYQPALDLIRREASNT